MARRPDPIRIETARRAATIARLISDGRSASTAAALVAEWEAIQTRSGPAPGRSDHVPGGSDAPGRLDWEGFDRWLAARARPGSHSM